MSAAILLLLLVAVALYACRLITAELARAFPRWEPLWWLRYAPYAALLAYLLWLGSSS